MAIKDLFFLTYTGRKFYPYDPKPEQFNIGDIARGLAFSNRFNGQTRRPYSIAQHCVHVASLVPRHLAPAALMHDAAEAYTGDLVAPVKRGLPQFDDLEDGIALALCNRYGLQLEELACHQIKDADMRALVTEQRDLRGFALHQLSDREQAYTPTDDVIVPLDPLTAEMRFLTRFRLLFPAFKDEAQEAIDRVMAFPDRYGVGV